MLQNDTMLYIYFVLLIPTGNLPGAFMLSPLTSGALGVSGSDSVSDSDGVCIYT